MIRLKTLIEQLGFALSSNNAFNLSKASGTPAGKTPGVEADAPTDFGATMPKQTTPQQRFTQTYQQAKRIKTTGDTTSRRKAQQLNQLVTGIGGNSQVLNVLKSIKTLQELSNVIATYKHTYKTDLLVDISAEAGLSWDSLWNSIKHLNPAASRYAPAPTGML
jgi:hypothetical protein